MTRRRSLRPQPRRLEEFFTTHAGEREHPPEQSLLTPQEERREVRETERSANKEAEGRKSRGDWRIDSPVLADTVQPAGREQGGRKKTDKMALAHGSSTEQSRRGFPSSPDNQKQRAESPDNQKQSSDSMDISEPQVDNRSEPQVDNTQDPFLTFNASAQPASESFIKEMLGALRGSIQNDFKTLSRSLNVTMAEMGERVEHIENKMGQLTSSHNDLIDVHYELEAEVQAIKYKLADMEDRSRRNNIKIRGIPERVSSQDLSLYLQDLIKKMLPDSQAQDLIIDRIHRLPKPKHIPDNLPRDVIARIHFYHVKESLMYAARKVGQLPAPYTDIRLFTDLSQATLLARKSFSPITATLRRENLPYKWGFPVKMIVRYKENTFVIAKPEEGVKLLKSWNLSITENHQDPPLKKPNKQSQLWNNPNHGC